MVVLQNGRLVSKQAARDANIRTFMTDYLGAEVLSDDEAFEKLASLPSSKCGAVADYIEEASA
jgi:hypothetical protein